MNIELYSLSCFQLKTLSQKDITFTCKCSSLHELFLPNLSPLVVLLSGYGEGLVTYLAESEIIAFRGYIPVLKIYIIML